jgi:hypothetical protein
VTTATHPVLLPALDGMVGGTGAEKLMPCAANAVKNIFKNEGKILKRTFCSQFFSI